MSTKTKSKLMSSDLFHLAIEVVIMALFWIIPPFSDALTPMGMKLLGVFIASCYGWCTVGIMWPTILAFCMLPFTGACTQAQLLIDGFANTVFLFLIFLFMFNQVVDESGLATFLANFAMSRKVVQGRPWLLIFSYMFASYILGMITNPFLTMFLMWSILYGISETLGFKKGNTLIPLMVVLTTCSMLMGYLTMPYQGIAVLLLAGFQNITGVVISYATYLMWSVPMGFGTLVLMWLLARFIVRPDVTLLREYDPSTMDPEKLKLGRKGKIVFAALLVLIIMLLSSTFLPAGNPIVWFVTTVGNWGVIAFICLALVFIKVDGEPIMNVSHCFKEGVQFEILMCCAYLLPLGTYMALEEAGISAWFMEILTPILGGLSPFLLALAIALLGLVLTQFMTNMVVAFMFFPVIWAFSQSTSLNAEVAALMAIYSCHIGILTPAACTYAAITHANSEWVTSPQVTKYGGLTFIIASIIMMVLGYFYGGIIV